MSNEIEDLNNDLEFLNNTEFIEKLIDNTPKISNKIYKTKLFKFMENSVLFMMNSKNEEKDELNLSNLDEYQLWALIENLSKNVFTDLNKNMKKEDLHKDIIKELKTQNTILKYDLLKNKRKNSENSDKEAKVKIIQEENYEDEFEDENENGRKYKNKKHDNFVQDKFFDLEEFNNIGEDDMGELALEEEENLEEENKPEEKKVHKEKPAKEKEDFKYQDFFNDEKMPSNKRTRYNQQGEEIYEHLDEDIEDNIFDLENKFINQDKEGIKNTYEFINEKVTDSIDDIEKNMMQVKAWHMKGEVKGKQRPKESLLENYLDFQVSIKPPPIPSVEMTCGMEKMIKLRIKEDLYDDPIRNKDINLNSKNKEPIELDFEKSKKGLGDLYEEDFNKEHGNANETESKELYKEIDELTNKLYNIFDKLTNNHFVSGNRNTEMKVITNVPSIQLEDISNFVTDNKSHSKSANEIYSRKDMETITKDEMTQEEKKKNHNHVKRNIRNRLKEKERNNKMKMLASKLDSKFEAKFAMKQMKDKSAKKNMKNSELKSSKFFDNIQTIATDDKNKKLNKADKKKSSDENTIVTGSAKSYKI